LVVWREKIKLVFTKKTTTFFTNDERGDVKIIVASLMVQGFAKEKKEVLRDTDWALRRRSPNGSTRS
jgi:hypothetical protein